MIALVVLLLVFMALMQTALVSINANMNNILRDEAVGLAERTIIDARNTPYDTLVAGTTTATENTYVRSLTVTYTATTTVTDRGVNDKQIDVIVTWTWKGEPYTHNMSTIRMRP
jgi:hypothetical protein